MLEERGLKRIYLNTDPDLPIQARTFIFASENIKNCKKLLVLIHGSGVVRAGQWSRKLTINNSLTHGTQLPYIDIAMQIGYEVLVTNTNFNFYIPDGYETFMRIEGHDTAEDHACVAWQKFAVDTEPEHIAIVAHSYGGKVVCKLAEEFPDSFERDVFAVAFTDSVHDANSDNEFLYDYTQNWVTSALPVDTPIAQSTSNANRDFPKVSAGHTEHEWTSYTAMDPIFDFLDRKFEEKRIRRNIEL